MDGPCAMRSSGVGCDYCGAEAIAGMDKGLSETHFEEDGGVAIVTPLLFYCAAHEERGAADARRLWEEASAPAARALFEAREDWRISAYRAKIADAAVKKALRELRAAEGVHIDAAIAADRAKASYEKLLGIPVEEACFAAAIANSR